MTTTEYARPDWQRRMSPRFKALAARDGLLCAYCAVPLVDPLNDEHWLWDGGGNYINCPDRVHDDGGCTHPEGCWFPLREMRTGIVEHVVPRAKGGGNHLDNLVLSCPGCNDQKGAKLLTDLPRGWWLAGLSRRARQWRDDEIDEQHERINVVWERARNHHVGQTRVVVAKLELVAPIATRPTPVADAEVGQLRAQRAAVLALHTPGPSRWTWQICTHCGGADEAVAWPCPTARALGVAE